MAIENYYLSINEEFLDKAISFTSTYNVYNEQDTIDIIKHCRKNILYNKGDIWQKKDNNSLFDVA